MATYQRGKFWWYRFRFAGERIDTLQLLEESSCVCLPIVFITAAVCCIGCRHTHVGVSPVADGVSL